MKGLLRPSASLAAKSYSSLLDGFVVMNFSREAKMRELANSGRFDHFHLRKPASWCEEDLQRNKFGIYTEGIIFCNVPVLTVCDRNDKVVAMTGWHVSGDRKCHEHFCQDFIKVLEQYRKRYGDCEQSVNVYARMAHFGFDSLDQSARLSFDISEEIHSVVKAFSDIKPTQRIIDSPLLLLEKGEPLKSKTITNSASYDYSRGR